jgi:hypothetical protein
VEAVAQVRHDFVEKAVRLKQGISRYHHKSI